MIQVWKCEHCYYTDVNSTKVSRHEPKCSFNKANKKCFTCKYAYEAGYYDSIPGCEIKLDTTIGREDGNCPGWVDEYLEEGRDKKINQIIQ